MLKITSTDILLNERKQVSLPGSFTKKERKPFTLFFTFKNVQFRSVGCVFVHSLSEDGFGFSCYHVFSENSRYLL